MYSHKKVHLWGERTNRLCTAPVPGGLLAGLKCPSVLGVVPGKSIPSRGSPRFYHDRLLIKETGGAVTTLQVGGT